MFTDAIDVIITAPYTDTCCLGHSLVLTNCSVGKLLHDAEQMSLFPLQARNRSNAAISGAQVAHLHWASLCFAKLS